VVEEVDTGVTSRSACRGCGAGRPGRRDRQQYADPLIPTFFVGLLPIQEKAGPMTDRPFCLINDADGDGV